MANTDYGSMNVSALKVELRKRGAKLNGLKEQLIQRLVFLYLQTISCLKLACLSRLQLCFSFYRLQDYDRNNNFIGNITDGIKNDDLAYTVE